MGIYAPNDVLYMRFFREGKVLRVARSDPARELQLALYPSDDSDIFYREVFREIDDNSPRSGISRSDVKDEIWLRLLDGEDMEGILSDYEPVGGSGNDNQGSYYFVSRGTKENHLRKRTFHIVDDRDEDEMLAEMEKNVKRVGDVNLF